MGWEARAGDLTLDPVVHQWFPLSVFISEKLMTQEMFSGDSL